jgi:hypothetical protein
MLKITDTKTLLKLCLYSNHDTENNLNFSTFLTSHVDKRVYVAASPVFVTQSKQYDTHASKIIPSLYKHNGIPCMHKACRETVPITESGRKETAI